MIKIEFNTSEFRQSLQRAKGRLGDLTGLHQLIRDYMMDATLKRFQTETDPDGKRWAPKASSTAAFYARKGYGGMAQLRVLYKSGKLGREIVQYANRSGAVIGSNEIYSGVMQDGASKGAFGSDRLGRPIPWGRIPARRWLGVSPSDEREIIRLTEDYLADVLGPDQGGN